jgi:hypothetical protein
MEGCSGWHAVINALFNFVYLHWSLIGCFPQSCDLPLVTSFHPWSLLSVAFVLSFKLLLIPETYEPLDIIIMKDAYPITVEQYAEYHGLLKTAGWKKVN